MHLTATGTEQRRALVLILHDLSSVRYTDTGTPLDSQRLVQDLVLVFALSLSKNDVDTPRHFPYWHFSDVPAALTMPVDRAKRTSLGCAEI